MAKRISETDKLADELKKKKEKPVVPRKGMTLSLTIEDHTILDTIADHTGETKGGIVLKLLLGNIRQLAMNLGLGEYNTDTMKFELYTEEEIEQFKKEGK